MSKINLKYEPSGITSGTTVEMFVDTERKFKVVDDQGTIFDSSQSSGVNYADFLNVLDYDTLLEDGPYTFKAIFNTNTKPTVSWVDSNDNIIHEFYVDNSYTPTYDIDSVAFFTAAGITDTNQKIALNDLVVDLKTNNLWTKMQALYPFIGGTSTAHKFNLKDPRDLDAAFRLTFNGSFTHDSAGVTGGANAWANSYFNPVTQSSSLTSHHVSIYIPAIIGSAAGLFAIQGDPLGNDMSGMIMENGTIRGFVGGEFNTEFAGFVNQTSVRAHHLVTTNGSRLAKYINRGNITGTNATQSQGFGNWDYYMFCRNRFGEPFVFLQNTVSFASIGTGLSDAEATTFYTIIQAYQTALGRQV